MMPRLAGKLRPCLLDGSVCVSESRFLVLFSGGPVWGLVCPGAEFTLSLSR